MGFECCHPVINLLYFAALIAASVLFRQPAFLAISYISAFAYSVKRNGRRAVFAGKGMVVSKAMSITGAPVPRFPEATGRGALCNAFGREGRNGPGNQGFVSTKRFDSYTQHIRYAYHFDWNGALQSAAADGCAHMGRGCLLRSNPDILRTDDRNECVCHESNRHVSAAYAGEKSVPDL